ncbi:MAG: lipoprotein insertase outer membrane protein LolB [Pseudomonadota bacterium]
MRAILLTLMLLAGCATAPVAVLRSPQVDAPFAFNGRVLIKHGSQRDSSGIHWEHHVRDEILLLGPLGYTVGRIGRDSRGATLEDASGKQYAAGDAESLMQEALGWQLPLSGLRYWVVAQPAPDVEFRIEHNTNGQVTVLRQQGWEIRYSRYAGSAPDTLPKQLDMSREGFSVLLQIDEWQAQ